ncbi:MAG: thiamine pyrophosphate-binding protein [Desulfarculaceae bacterium]|nr:thiamine pyrophosphate-binding protein [Desulfarculaceae bacterium]MCF8074129.1 thiamine pyrophosphate-binding protein [Desulfarculaceae bacterium]MCF8103279.1 thiamine pyrophosphate-binding protein [Desulfarculaceae bacterium]MCF8116863.1 thiamine pyrophosphate-binding protein [Desulfarculaceae bacterium]
MANTTPGAIIAAMLAAEGVTKLFGIVDGTYLALLKGCVQDQGMEFITPRHESCAAHMAGAYARLTGQLGVCIASNGPGVANMLGGVATEQMEGNRVLLITSSRRSAIAYPDRGGAYQCFDQVGAIGAMAKYSVCADSAARVPELLKTALRAAWSGRPGVVHLDVPEDVMNGECKPMGLPQPAAYRATAPLEPDPRQVEEAARLLAGAKLPMIHAGSGIIHAQAYAELAELAELLHAPVTTSWAARGALSEDSPLAWPLLHIKAVNSLRNAADVALVLGSEMGETDWWGKPPYWAPWDQQKMIQVDIDPEVLGRIRPADLLVQADVKRFLRELIAALTGKKDTMPLEERRATVEKLAQEKTKDRAKLDEKLGVAASPMITAQVGQVAGKLMDRDAVLVLDGGNAAVWGSFYSTIHTPGCLLGTHHHTGQLGAGTSMALGAAVARPGAQVYCITGDGAMGFHPQELETAVRHGLKAIYLVCCDRQWGMVKINQCFAMHPVQTMLKKSLDKDKTIGTDLGPIAWDELARSMGAFGARVSDPEGLKAALKEAIAQPLPALIMVEVDPVKHMWAPGLIHFKAMHQEPKGK